MNIFKQIWATQVKVRLSFPLTYIRTHGHAQMHGGLFLQALKKNEKKDDEFLKVWFQRILAQYVSAPTTHIYYIRPSTSLPFMIDVANAACQSG